MTGSVIGALRVNLGLDSAQFSRGAKQATSAYNGMAAKIGKWAGGIAASAGTAFAALAVGAAKTAAEITRLSQVANAGPEQFQGWAAGAQSVGIEQEKLADILKDVNDRVGDFVQTGGGPMADFFEKIAPKVGVSAAQFRNLSGPDALQLYVDTLQKANVNQQDFTFYMEAMASDSTLLLPLLRDGGKGMAEYAAQAQRVGAILSGETLKGLTEAKKAMGDMSLAASGIRNSLGAIAAPAIVAIGAAVTAAATLIHQNSGVISTALNTAAGTAIVVATVFAGQYAVALGVTAVKSMISFVVQSIALNKALGATSTTAALAATGVKLMTGALALLRGAIIATGIGALIIGAGYLVGKFVELVRATGGFGNALKLLGDVGAGVWGGLVAAAGSIPVGLEAIWAKIKSSFFGLVATLTEKWANFLHKIAGFSFIGEGVRTALDNQVADLDVYTSDLIAMGEEAAAAGDAAAARAGEIAAAGMARAGEALGALNVAVQEAESSTTNTTKTITDMGNAGGGAAGKLSKLQEVLKRLKEEGAELAATINMGDLDAEVWRNQRDAGVSADSANGRIIDEQTRINAGLKTLKESTDEWAQSGRDAFKSFITGGSSFKDLVGSIAGKLGDMWLDQGFQAIFNAGGKSGPSGVVGSILSAIGIGKNANGTSNWRGGLTSINERGGEIVDLPNRTRIIPHDVSMRMAKNAQSGPQGIAQIVPSPYFDVVVDQRATGVAAPMVGQSARMQQRTMGERQMAYNMRGTPT